MLSLHYLGTFTRLHHCQDLREALTILDTKESVIYIKFVLYTVSLIRQIKSDKDTYARNPLGRFSEWKAFPNVIVNRLGK